MFSETGLTDTVETPETSFLISDLCLSLILFRIRDKIRSEYSEFKYKTFGVGTVQDYASVFTETGSKKLVLKDIVDFIGDIYFKVGFIEKSRGGVDGPVL